jgi:hypothetical protein
MQQLTLLTIFFVAVGLASATKSLTEEQIEMSNNGTLLYGSLSFNAQLELFKEYESNCKREVILRGHVTMCPAISFPLRLIYPFYASQSCSISPPPTRKGDLKYLWTPCKALISSTLKSEL